MGSNKKYNSSNRGIGSNYEYRMATRNIEDGKGFMCPMCNSFIVSGQDCCPVCGEMPSSGGSSQVKPESLVKFLIFNLVFIAPLASMISAFLSNVAGDLFRIPSLIILAIMAWITLANVNYVIKACNKKGQGIIIKIWKLKYSFWILIWLTVATFQAFGYLSF